MIASWADVLRLALDHVVARMGAPGIQYDIWTGKHGDLSTNVAFKLYEHYQQEAKTET